MPRPYCLGRRQAATEQTRARIIDAARTLLTTDQPAGKPGKHFAGLSIDAVAQQASVARMTVYYQFGSKRGLIEALLDDLAVRGKIDRIGDAFEQADPQKALHQFITALAHLWTVERRMIRRLSALAVLDPDIEQSLRERHERRRDGTRAIIDLLARARGESMAAQDEAADALYMLTSFASFDALAGASREPDDVIPLVYRLACAALGFPADERAG